MESVSFSSFSSLSIKLSHVVNFKKSFSVRSFRFYCCSAVDIFHLCEFSFHFFFGFFEPPPLASLTTATAVATPAAAPSAAPTPTCSQLW